MMTLDDEVRIRVERGGELAPGYCVYGMTEQAPELPITSAQLEYEGKTYTHSNTSDSQRAQIAEGARVVASARIRNESSESYETLVMVGYNSEKGVIKLAESESEALTAGETSIFSATFTMPDMDMDIVLLSYHVRGEGQEPCLRDATVANPIYVATEVTGDQWRKVEVGEPYLDKYANKWKIPIELLLAPSSVYADAVQSEDNTRYRFNYKISFIATAEGPASEVYATTTYPEAYPQKGETPFFHIYPPLYEGWPVRGMRGEVILSGDYPAGTAFQLKLQELDWELLTESWVDAAEQTVYLSGNGTKGEIYLPETSPNEDGDKAIGSEVRVQPAIKNTGEVACTFRLSIEGIPDSEEPNTSNMYLVPDQRASLENPITFMMPSKEVTLRYEVYHMAGEDFTVEPDDVVEVTLTPIGTYFNVSGPYLVNGSQRVDIELLGITAKVDADEGRYRVEGWLGHAMESDPCISVYTNEPTKDLIDSFEIDNSLINDNRRVLIMKVAEYKPPDFRAYHMLYTTCNTCKYRTPRPNLILSFDPMEPGVVAPGETCSASESVKNTGDKESNGGTYQVLLDGKVMQEHSTGKIAPCKSEEIWWLKWTIPMDTSEGEHEVRTCVFDNDYPDIISCTDPGKVFVTETKTKELHYDAPGRSGLWIDYDMGSEPPFELPGTQASPKGHGFTRLVYDGDPSAGGKTICQFSLHIDDYGNCICTDKYKCIISIEGNEKILIYPFECDQFTMPEECFSARCFWYNHTCNLRYRWLADKPSRRNVWSPIYPGVNIGSISVGGGTWGTFGCLVLKGGQKMLLTNSHVVAGLNQAQIGDVIFQGNSSNKIGVIEDFIPLISEGVETLTITADCGIVKPYDPANVLPNILDSGDQPGYAPTGVRDPYVGEDVAKSGAKTGVVTGEVLSVNTTVLLNTRVAAHPTYRLKDAFVTTRMCDGGDSGSMTMDSNTKEAIGLVCGSSKTQSIHCIMSNVLAALGCTLYTEEAEIPILPEKGVLITVIPEEAVLYVDGNETQDRTLSLSVGAHALQMILDSYNDLVARIEVSDVGVTCISGPCYSVEPPSITTSNHTVVCRLKESPPPPPQPPPGERGMSFDASSYAFGDVITVLYNDIAAGRDIIDLGGRISELYVAGQGRLKVLLANFGRGRDFFTEYIPAIYNAETNDAYNIDLPPFELYNDLETKIYWAYGTRESCVLPDTIPIERDRTAIVMYQVNNIDTEHDWRYKIISPSGVTTEHQVEAQYESSDHSYLFVHAFKLRGVVRETGLWTVQVLRGDGSLVTSVEKHLFIPSEGTIEFNKDVYTLGESGTVSFNGIPEDSYFSLWHCLFTACETGRKELEHNVLLSKGSSIIDITFGRPGHYKGEVSSPYGTPPLITDTCGVLRPVKKRVQLTSIPTGAEVYINDHFVGSETTVDILQGAHKLEWNLEGYAILQAQIEVDSERVSCISVEKGTCDSSTAPGLVCSSDSIKGYLEKGYGYGTIDISASSIPKGIYTNTPAKFTLAILNLGSLDAEYTATVIFKGIDTDHREEFSATYDRLVKPGETVSLPIDLLLSEDSIPKGRDSASYSIYTRLEGTFY